MDQLHHWWGEDRIGLKVILGISSRFFCRSWVFGSCPRTLPQARPEYRKKKSSTKSVSILMKWGVREMRPQVLARASPRKGI